MFFHVTSSLLTFARVHVNLGNLLKWRICIFWEKHFFVWLIFSAVCLCLNCCLLHVRTREARLLTYEATFQYPVFVFFGTVPLEACRGFTPVPLIFRYFCTSRDTRGVCLCWCHTAVSLETEQPCLFHHSFVRPAGLYPCLENSEKPQLHDCIRYSSVSLVRAFACLRRHVGCDSTCLWCRCPSVTSRICIVWEKRFFVWLIFSAVCLCLNCCLLHVRTREARLLTYEATFQYPVFVSFGTVPLEARHPCLRRLHSRSFFSAISVPHVTHVMSACVVVIRQFLLRLNRASSITLLCVQLVCTRASRTPRSHNCVTVYASVPCLLYVHLLVSGVMLAVTLRASGADVRPSRGAYVLFGRSVFLFGLYSAPFVCV